MSTTDVALVAAHLALQHVCVCGHGREKHAPSGDFCFACANNRDDCERFVAVTAVVTVQAKPQNPDAADERHAELYGLMADDTIRGILSAAVMDALNLVGQLAQRNVPRLHQFIAMNRDTAVDDLTAMLAGWLVGFSVAHQDRNARSFRIDELIAIVRQAAETSGALSAQIERRSLH